MIEALIMWVLYVVVLGLIVWLLLYLNDTLPVPEPFHTIVRAAVLVIGVIIVIVLLLNVVGGIHPGGTRLRF